MDVDREYTDEECLVAHTEAIRWLIEHDDRASALLLAQVTVTSISEVTYPEPGMRLCGVEMRGPREVLERIRPLTDYRDWGEKFQPGVRSVNAAFNARRSDDVDDFFFDLVVVEEAVTGRHQGSLYPGPGKVEYGGLRYRSRTEARIAQVLDDMNVLYFPLPVAVRHHNKFEPDFVIVHMGRVGVLEVDGPTHTGETRAKEDVRAEWYSLSGVLVRHYDVKDIDRDAQGVVRRFLRSMRGPVL